MGKELIGSISSRDIGELTESLCMSEKISGAFILRVLLYCKVIGEETCLNDRKNVQVDEAASELYSHIVSIHADKESCQGTIIATACCPNDVKDEDLHDFVDSIYLNKNGVC